MSTILDSDIQLIDEHLYSFNSTDNERSYDIEAILGHSTYPSSIFGLVIHGIPRLVVGAPGGPTIIDENCMLRAGDDIIVAIGSYVYSYSLSQHKLNWDIEIDDAACFGIYYEQDRDGYFSHGELSITRFDLQGKILWQSSGADILTEGFRLAKDYVEVIDFNEDICRFNYKNGKPIKTA